ncbi:tetratricopeptide repeat protein [Halodesulfovibrio marinisediminis]|uniref:Tetratricopeptide repeat-containing protein n=1 Tax=Halodesulfovibrio marinisediminis DSM 17456 TaxID=1121457 RepID=A0A1N6F231_9BACT|nr:tetratricopeptide repeat protein [Halodesulfovibrio marinisediminis]SIN89342.1 Tetratricopeptide repeat-containing protein [Halodesulfovibrio marinisediminis DSM 17456]
MCAAKEIGAMNKAGMAAMAEGNYMNAEFMMHQAIRRAERLGVDTYTAKLKNNFGIILNVQGKKQEAAVFFDDALATITRTIGTDNKLYRTIEANLHDAQAGQA